MSITAEIVQHTVALASAHLLFESGKEAFKEGVEGAAQLLSWLRTTLTGRAKEALADLENNPGEADNQADLRKQLMLLFNNNPALLGELRAIIGEPKVDGAGQNMTLGANARAIQNKGKNNTNVISG